MEHDCPQAAIRHTGDVVGGDARARNTRIPAWTLEQRVGAIFATLFAPRLTRAWEVDMVRLSD